MGNKWSSLFNLYSFKTDADIFFLTLSYCFSRKLFERINIVFRCCSKVVIREGFLFCPQVMLDTVGAELQVVNKSEKAISLQADGLVVLTPDQGQEASSELLPINFDGLSKV